jgi:hypothetical protein
MSENITRRDLLKMAATTGAVSTIATVGTATSGPSARIAEVGLRFDIPDENEYHGVLLDSRPPFTVDDDRDEFVLAEHVDPTYASAIEHAGFLVDEHPTKSGESVLVGPDDGFAGALPTELSARMRPKRALSLASDNRVPTVTLHRTGTDLHLSVESNGTMPLEPQTEREVRLEPKTVDAQIVHRSESNADIPGRPAHRIGPSRTFESVEVEVTPVVEIVDHGELSVTRRKLA